MNKKDVEMAVRVINHYKSESNTPHIIASCDFAISAIEKQIPKKPIEEQGISPRCPYCENANYLTNEDEEENSYCGNCGQAIDWGNEDD